MQQGEGRGRPRSVSEPRLDSGLAQQDSRRAKKKKTSRDSSVSSSGREVRCGCQYFQTDSLLPERVTLVGRPPSRTSNMAATTGEHEYEVINPPPPRVDVDPPSDERRDAAVAPPPGKRIDSETSSLASGDPHFVRDADGYADAEDSARDLQAHMEERFLAATPETTASRTDCDVNTSQLDSSGLEDLPLRRGSRRRKEDMEEEAAAEARTLQHRIRSQAGRLRAKIRSMKMPDRPKFNMPERPKFNMPERPKFNMPERPKFNLPDRPKFNLPERPKFKMPERPKFNMPERPKFNMPERPKFNLPERPKFKMPERPKFNMPAMPAMPTFKREPKSPSGPKKTSSLRRPLKDRTNPSTESNASSSRKHRLFDFDFRTYPRLFDRSRRKGGEYATSSPKSMTPPPSLGSSDRPQTPIRKKGPVGSRWVHRFTDIKFADDEEHRQVAEYEEDDEPFRRDMDFRMDQADVHLDPEEEEEFRREQQRYENEVRDAVEEMDRQRQERDSIHTESTTAFRDKDYDYAVGLHLGELSQPAKSPNESVPDSTREERSSGGGSSGKHRAGVLEEIDSDEFFLRQKGISQEDVDMGRYLTSEIREAFRPPANALSQMDYQEEDDGDLGNQYRGTPEREPVPPARTRSLKPPRKRTTRAQGSADELPPGYGTFPIARPRRGRRQRSALPHQQRPSQEAQEMGYEGEMEEGEEQHKADDEWQDMDDSEAPPLAPKRVRRSRPQPAAHQYVPEHQRNGHVTPKDEWRDEISPQEVVALRMEHDYTVPDVGDHIPVAPKRERRRASSRGASTHSLAEDRTSRAGDSLPRDDVTRADDLEEEIRMEVDVGVETTPVVEEQPEEAAVPPPRPARQVSQDVDGYAIVEKVYPAKPVRPGRAKTGTSRPAAPVRRKRLTNHFFSLPRKAPPVRPLRNYSTLGPSRPSRRERARRSEPYAEIKDDELSPSDAAADESHPSNRDDLQSGDVVERMKGRPLPAPPRPPRKTKEGESEAKEGEPEVQQEGEMEVKQEGEPGDEEVSEHALGALNDAVFYSAKESIAPVAIAATEMPSSAVQEAAEVPVEKPEAAPPDQVTQPAVPEDREAFLVQDDLPVAAEPPPAEEVTVATQTDPLPDDYCMEVGDEEQPPPEQADACTDTADMERKASLVEAPAPAPAPPPPPTVIEREVPVYIMPDRDTVIELKAERLQVSDLDVERLNVGELQAQKILVSDIDGVSMQVAELSSKSGRLLLNGVEFPPGFLQDLYDSLPRPEPPPPPPPPAIPEPPPPPPPAAPQDEPISKPPPSEPAPPQPAAPPPTEPAPPPIPPPPQPQLAYAEPPSIPYSTLPPTPPLHIPMDPRYSYIPSAMRVKRSQMPDMDSEEEVISFIPAPHRRRRHHASKPAPPPPRYSTDDEEEAAASASHQASRRHPQRSGDPSVGELSRQLGTAVTASSMRALRSIVQYTTAQLEGEDKRRELQTVLCILLILVAGLILMGFGTGKTFHYHHWDYLNPPK